MTFDITPAYDGDSSQRSRSGTMSHMLPCTATVTKPASPFISDPSTKGSPSSAVSLPCGPGQTSPLQRSPGGSDCGEHGSILPGRHGPSPTRRISSTRQTCSTEGSSDNRKNSHNCHEGSSSSSTEGNTNISSNKTVSRETASSSVSGSNGQAGEKFSSGNLTYACSSTSTSRAVRTGGPSSSGSKEVVTEDTDNPVDTERTATTTGGSSMQFGSAKPWNASAWPPVTSSTSDASSSGEKGHLQLFRADGTISEQHLRELRLVCRLIGLHSRPRLQKGQRINVYLHGSGVTSGKGGLAAVAANAVPNIGGACGATAPCNLGLGFSPSLFVKRTGSYDNPLGLSPNEEIKVLGGVDIGANTKCLFFLNDNEDHLYICFNWFDPKNVIDVVSLSCRVASSFRLHPAETSSSFNEDMTLDQLPFLEASRRSALAFWSHPEFQELLRDGGAVLRPSTPPGGSNAGSAHQDQPLMQTVCRPPFRRASFSSNLQAITCGGFSIGGPTAFYVASLLSVHISPDVPLGPKGRQRIRAIAFGSPRFCGEKFVRWCEQHLASSSCSVILYSTAQHSQQQEPREALQEQLQKHQHAWVGSSLQQGLAADASEHQNDQTNKEQRLILDPVCVQGSANDGFVVQPNTILLRVGGGLMRMGKRQEEEAATAAEEVALNSSSIMWNMATRVSPFTKVYNERYAMLHSVLRYYEALADT